MFRSISEKWEISQDHPSPYEPIRLKKHNLAPCFTSIEYVKYINECGPIQSFHRYDEYYKMFGHYVKAEIIDNEVWVTFVPSKLGDYWINYNNPNAIDYTELDI